ncbi:hypothetical protein AB0H88_04855 [Nonomuraea sp. NPDC050680]|uniref:hypothetical protein n=1 Tax=Nonomuraea sp. NPDC050680 TaxID=3154630 RepID=UPI0033C0F768
MRLRNQVIGAMNLFRQEPGEMPAPTVALAQALADIATIGLLQGRTIREGQDLSEQCGRPCRRPRPHALPSRPLSRGR